MRVVGWAGVAGKQGRRKLGVTGWEAKESGQKQPSGCSPWSLNAKHVSGSQDMIQYKAKGSELWGPGRKGAGFQKPERSRKVPGGRLTVSCAFCANKA